MRLILIAVGQKMPDWAQSAFDDYAKRFPPEIKLDVRLVKTQPRHSSDVAGIMAAERHRIEAQIPKGVRLVVLDERGDALTTKQLAQSLTDWQMGGTDIALVIGGPDGLDSGFKQQAHQRIRLSSLTLPHAVARVLLVEQLYRAWSVTQNHPYHRE